MGSLAKFGELVSHRADRFMQRVAGRLGWTAKDRATSYKPSKVPSVIPPPLIEPLAKSDLNQVVFNGSHIYKQYDGFRISYHMKNNVFSKFSVIQEGRRTNYSSELPSQEEIDRFVKDVNEAAKENEIIRNAISSIKEFS